jgi:hypothetical protein
MGNQAGGGGPYPWMTFEDNPGLWTLVIAIVDTLAQRCRPVMRRRTGGDVGYRYR